MEREFHSWLAVRDQRKLDCGKASQRETSVQLGIGDDAAIVKFSQASLVIATDTIAAGTHFLPLEQGAHQTQFQQVGRKALAVSLSDIAAMGAVPEAATLNFQCPEWAELDHVQAVFMGAQSLAQRFNFQIVGGDTNSWPGQWVLTSTVFGTRSAGLTGWGLCDARVDDAILVSGELGGSIHGRHLTFEPRLTLAAYLAKKYFVGAATDVTDSLSIDLMAIARGSQRCCEIDLATIPVSPDIALDGISAIEHALCDGEDFELIFTLSQNEADQLMAADDLPVRVTQIGKIVAGPAGIIDRAGNQVPVRGYNH